MTKKEMEARLRYLEDYLAIWKLQSTYQHYHHQCMWTKIPSLFAKKTPGVEIWLSDKGVLEGSDAPQRYFDGVVGKGKDGPPFPGWLGLHTAVNPVIEINKDGNRAKALWQSPGLMTFPTEGKLTACWWYGRYDMEYAKEDDEWKILKLKWRQTFATHYDKGWVEQSLPSHKGEFAFLTDRPVPPGYYEPYSADKSIVFGPPPPEPYDE